MYPDSVLKPAELRASGLLLKSHLLAARADRSADAGEKKRLLAQSAELERQGKALLQ